MLEYSKLVSNGVKYNQYNLKASFRNNLSTMFDSDNYTPGESSFLLFSKYDIQIYNSDDQLVDLSDITVYKNNSVYLTD